MSVEHARRAATWTCALAACLAIAPAVSYAAAADPPATATRTAPPATPAPLPTDPNEPVAATVKEPLAGLVEPGSEQKLSNETTITRWAHAQATSKVLSEPRPGARTITRLRYLTEDKAAEVYIVLAAKLDASKRTWLNIRVPMRRQGRTGWVLADDLSALYVVRTQLVIDRKSLKATLFKNAKKVWQAPVGIGKAGTPTPSGDFWVRERLKGLGNNSAYGPWAFGTSAYSNISDWPGGGVVGIHGTNEPGKVPGRPSHGCVRLRNDKIRSLVRLMPIGTPVRIVR
jgi:lipoprotein-anchoring transpeptidase ErfK/SrfK